MQQLAHLTRHKPHAQLLVQQSVRQLRRFRDLQELDLPLILLVGGGTGTGKSTVATEVAYRLGITRVTSTDFVRQTMGAFFAKEFMPSIHYSSFEAADGLREPEQAEDPVISGFMEQTRNVLVGVRASLERALEEGWDVERTRAELDGVVARTGLHMVRAVALRSNQRVVAAAGG